MSRKLEVSTLDMKARQFAFAWGVGHWPGWPERGREWMTEEFHNLTYKDEFDYMVERVPDHIAGESVDTFMAAIADLRSRLPRTEEVLAEQLARKQAVDLDGEHIPGRIGTNDVGGRLMGIHEVEVEMPGSIKIRKQLGTDKSHRQTYRRLAPRYWPIYAGEGHERAADSGVADPLPEGTPGLPVGAFATRVSLEAAIVMCDGMVDLFEEGTGAGIIRIRDGGQPTNVNDAPTGTLLGTLVYQDPAFGGAVDAGPGAIATRAGSITDDSSADATFTAGYVRCSSSNDGATPLNDHLDGEAGTSGSDWIFNSTAITAGSTISATNHTVTHPEG